MAIPVLQSNSARGKTSAENIMIQECFIHHRGNQLHYVRAGTGKNALLVFHGFGQDQTVYVPLLKSLSPHYTLYIVDLFFHGKSVWNQGESPLTRDGWNDLIDVLLREQHITSFSVLAYSLGGKFAFATLEGYAGRVRELFLLAPDGIRTSFWYSLATYPAFFRRIFKSMILHPERFQIIASQLNRLRLVDRGLIRFADFQMNTEEKRKRVYYSWVVFRHLNSDLKKIGSLINQHAVRLTLVAGKYDKVIPPENMRGLLKHVRDYRFEVIESGHTALVTEGLRVIMAQHGTR